MTAGGLEPALELISEDFVVEIPGSMSAEPDVYGATTARGATSPAFDGLIEDVRFEPIEFVEEGDAVIVWLRLTGRGAASGIEVEQHAAVVTRVEGRQGHGAWSPTRTWTRARGALRG